ncbi:SPFH domain-containing protein [Oculatella sp. LEGE 06141]|uniref:SPFH domain-containing protein n=1 Tax=Oculatella sp. LEGE 06141 TaxID=1828648 RepID=UPI001880E93D|nr:SPFH domain-containing protein [Oculatella sp. LEGE 06141]MBE9181441.1 SPFH domain-containing protein [Oculatella sp. LEGE 06141]
MGIFDKIMGEFVDIIEWLDQTNDTIVYRFQRHNNEIKMGAKLTVRPGQQAIFVNEGQIGDAFGPGMYSLSTQNLPVLSTLKGWPYGFNSPFKAEVYFFNTKVFTNLKWGTSNPITIRDSELGPVRLRAFGSYNICVANPSVMLQQLVSTDGLFQVDEVSDHIRNMIVTAYATWFARAGISLYDFASHYSEMGETIRTGMQPEIQRFGLELTQLLIENVSLPPEVEAALDKRASMGILGNMQQYAQFQAANAVEESARNPNGGNMALDFGVGIAMGQQLTNSLQHQPPNVQTMPQASAPATPPPPPVAVQWYISRDGQNLGPFAANQLTPNGLTAQTYVWHAGMDNWLRAAEVPELASVLASVPPPPPAS